MTAKQIRFGCRKGTVMLAFSAASASAAYACVGNVCWVLKRGTQYPAESKVIVREETWKPTPDITIRDSGRPWILQRRRLDELVTVGAFYLLRPPQLAASSLR